MKDTSMYEGKRILIVGLGKSGLAALEVLTKLGAKISVQDNKELKDLSEETQKKIIESEAEQFLKTLPEDMGVFDILVLSPGVPRNMDFIVEAERKGAEIIGELELAYRLAKGKFVAITGTNGKTTTTSLVGEIFKIAGRKTNIVGNIGKPAVLSAMEDDEDTWHITEVSSFQLETIKQFKPISATILNITPDHMDRHKNMENYGYAKRRIVENQGMENHFVVNFEDKFVMEMARGTKGTMVPFSKIDVLKFGVFTRDDNIIVRNSQGETLDVLPIAQLNILGKHNLENALAATALCYFSGIEISYIAEGLKAFKGVEHRLEFVEDIDEIRFINDSKATNTDAAIKAIEAMDRPIVLIAGGYDKNAEFSKLVSCFGSKVKNVVLMGATATKMKVAIEEKGYNSIIVRDMQSCVNEAFRLAQEGEVVLLSPACASWDMYSSFEERGKEF